MHRCFEKLHLAFVTATKLKNKDKLGLGLLIQSIMYVCHFQ